MASNSNRNRLIIALDAIISLAIIAFILNMVGLQDVLHSLSSLNFVLLAFSMILLLAMYLGMMTRIKLLLNAMGINAKWHDIARSHWVGMLLADFTPARTGYFATAARLTNHGIQSEKALLSIFGPQIFDFSLKLVIGTISVYYLLVNFLKPENGTILFLGTAGMIVIICLMLLMLFSSRFLKLFSFVKSWPLAGYFYGLLDRMQLHSDVVVRKAPQLLALMLFTHSMKAFSWYLVAKSLGITIDISPFPEFLFFFFFQPLVTMLEFLPSPTLAGLGLSEGGSTLVMALFGVSPAAAATFALVARFKTTAINLIAVPDAISLLHKTDLSALMKAK